MGPLPSGTDHCWIIADLHLLLPQVASDRGVGIGEHLVAVGEAMGRIPHGERLILLGDVAGVDPMSFARSMAWLREHAGHLVLEMVEGDHEPSHPMHGDLWRREEHIWRPVYDAVIARRDQVRLLHHQDRPILLSHFPYTGPLRSESVYAPWRPSDQGLDLVHGHTHQSEPTVPERPRQVCASWDAWGGSIPTLAQCVERLDRAAERTAGQDG